MSILSANLKHLYQRPGLCAAYFFIVPLVVVSVVLPFLDPSPGQGKFMGLVMLEFLIGMLVSSLQVEILTKPFSFCLPGHRALPRKLVFWTGVITSIPGSLVFLAYPFPLGWEQAPEICGSAFCASLIFYWLGAAPLFGVMNSNAITGWHWLPIFGIMFFDLHVIAERVIVTQPSVVIFIGLSSSVAVWIWLGNPSWARRLCAVSRIFIFDTWNPKKLQEHARRRQAAKLERSRVNPWVERFFLGRMKKCHHPGSGRYIWGELYTTYGKTLSRWREIVTPFLFIVAMMLFFSYSRPSGTNIFFFMVGLFVAHMRLPIYSCMTISGGRNERFITSIALAGTYSLLVTAALTAISFLSVALALIMPVFTFRGVELTFHVTSLRLLIVPSVIIPIVLAIRLLTNSKLFTTFVAITLFCVLSIVSGTNAPGKFYKLFNPVLLTCLLISGWLVLVLVLRHVCMKRSFVGQSRTY